jgi:hypothetical protein
MRLGELQPWRGEERGSTSPRPEDRPADPSRRAVRPPVFLIGTPILTAVWLLLMIVGAKFMDAIERALAQTFARAIDRERNDPILRTDLDRLLRRQIP